MLKKKRGREGGNMFFTAYWKHQPTTPFYRCITIVQAAFTLKLPALHIPQHLPYIKLSNMNSLSKDQKDELATSMAVLALYDGGVSFHAMTLSAHDPFQSSLAI
jgi:hypothetical protein